MTFYWFNKKEILQKTKKRYSKGKPAEYYSQNKEAMKKSQGIDKRTFQKKKNKRLKSIKEKYISN